MRLLSSFIACAMFATLIAETELPLITKSNVQKQKENSLPPSLCPGTFKKDCMTYEVYGELLYLQPNGSDLYYGAEAIGLNPNVATPVLSPDWNILEISPEYRFGFEVGTSIRLNRANVKIDLNWERLHTTDKDSFEAPLAPGYMVGQIFDIGPNSAVYKTAKGKAISNFDEANLRIGKQVLCFNNFTLQFYAGASFSRIQHTLSSKYSNPLNASARTVKTSSTFTGAGPEVGLDYRFRMVDNFFFSGNSTIPFFMGQLKNYTTIKSYSPAVLAAGNPYPNVQNTNVPNRTQFIPGFEQKMGFTYFVNTCSLRATFELGYQFQIYMNAIQTMDMISQALPADAVGIPSVGVFALAFNRTLSNFILTGPYAFVGFEF